MRIRNYATFCFHHSRYMTWADELFDRLAAAVPCGYHPTEPAASEPTALAALALSAAGRNQAAGKALDWLAAVQQADGSVSATAQPDAPGADQLGSPRGGTSSSPLPWQERGRGNGGDSTPHFVAWLLQARRRDAQAGDVGHNSELVGWPYGSPARIPGVEPAAEIAVLALRASGHADHARTQEAICLLIDRLLSTGGCNYGNTIVLGRELRPHVGRQLGVAMLATTDPAGYKTAALGDRSII